MDSFFDFKSLVAVIDALTIRIAAYEEALGLLHEDDLDGQGDIRNDIAYLNALKVELEIRLRRLIETIGKPDRHA